MKICCYFAAAEGVHPNCTIADYDAIWPVMQKSVEAQGYELIHLTSLNEPARCKNVMRVDVDPATVMWSREHAWVAFLKTLEDDEQGVLVEPDCILLKPIPPLRKDADALLLSHRHNIPPGFRLAKRTSLPFYEAVIEEYAKLPLESRVMHGDVIAVMNLLRKDDPKPRLLTIDNKTQPMFRLPASWNGVRFEHRNWIDYTSKLWRNAVAWNFKGTSKDKMLSIARGKPLPLR